MILVGNQRGGASDLARHLMKPENERIEVHQIRGFAADDLGGALRESYAISRGTRCKQHLFSLSLSPPPAADVGDESFEKAIDRAEDRLGLKGQPRAIVFHVKDGRRHAHAVWCRINAGEMKAVQLSHSKTKLNGLARELYIEHGWQMPRGFMRDHAPNPRNYTLAEWQQAKRAKREPEKLKAMFQDAWAMSDSKASLSASLREHGLILAKGDRRGFVAVDHRGEVFSLSRWIGIKAKDVRARLGSDDGLLNAKQARVQAAKIITDRLDELRREQAEKAKRAKARAAKRAHELKGKAKAETARLQAELKRKRTKTETAHRQQIRTGWRGVWDWVTGRKKRRQMEFEKQRTEEIHRDAAQLQKLKADKQDRAGKDKRRRAYLQQRRAENIRELKRDIADLSLKPEFEKADKRERFKDARKARRHERGRSRGREGPRI